MKRSDSLYIGLTLVVFLLSVAGWAVLSPFVPATDDDVEASLAAAGDHRYTVAGEQYAQDPSQFTRICLGTDCIPSLTADQVQYTDVTAADTWLDASDMVISITQQNETVAYPIPILQYHTIVNTQIAGHPIVVTYAPHAGYGTAFSRQTADTIPMQNMLFRFTGNLLHGDIVMQDTATEMYWSPYHGEAIYGTDTGHQLERIDTRAVRWSLWKQHHPNSSVLSRNTGVYNRSRYEDDAYFTYRSDTAVPGEAPDTGNLHPKDVVYGVTANGAAAAYRDVHIKDFELIQDTVGTTPILLVQDESTGLIHGFNRDVNGTTLDFTFDQDTNRMETSDGTTWTLDGTAVAGPRQGQQLKLVDLSRMYWFAWKQFNPDTDLYTP